MTQLDIESLGIIAGRGVYPLLLAEAARRRGARRIVAAAFRGETDRSINKLADDVHWLHVGQLQELLDTLAAARVRRAVMAGQITPTNLFRVRPDARCIALLKRLPVKNAETIFGAVAEELRSVGIELLPASSFMEDYMPAAGVLSCRPPSESEWKDIEHGLMVARATSALDIGQTVAVKQGVVLAVEAFEGTDEAIARAARLGGPGIVVVKVAKRGHDMRFDIPVVGMHTVKVLRKARAAAMAVEAGRCIILEREAVMEAINRCGIAMAAVEAESG